MNTRERIAEVLKEHTGVINNAEYHELIEVVNYGALLDALVELFKQGESFTGRNECLLN